MIARLLLALLLAATLAPAVVAGQARDYAYVFLQGRLTDASTGRPLTRVAVRLASSDATFEALTDERGVFTFEKLPKQPLELRITTPEGKVIRGVQRGDPEDPEGMRFVLKLGRGYGAGIRIETTRERTAVEIPEPETKWGKLWKEVAIFAGAAALLAL